MTDLQQEWQNMSHEIQLQSENVAFENVLIDQQSHHLLQSLLWKLKWKLRWIRIIDISLLVLAFLAKGHLQLFLLGLFLSYELCHIIGLHQFKKIKTGVDYTANALQVLKNNFSAITSILKMERLWGYIFLPLSGPVGIVAFLLYKYGNIATVITTPYFLLKITLMALLGIPLLLIAKKMNDSIFKNPIHELQQKINALEQENNESMI